MSNQRFAITNASIVTPERLIPGGCVVIGSGRIAAVLESRQELPTDLSYEVDASGALLIPGLIDVHNDSLENEVNPRPGANLPLEFALNNAESRLLCAGVTSEFHAISFMNMEKSGRTVHQAAERTAHISASGANHRIDHHVLHRLDVWNPAAMDDLFASVRNFSVGYVSLNDHTPGQGQYRDLARYTTFMKEWRQQRGGQSLDENDVYQRMASRAADTVTVQAVYERVEAERQSAPFVLATHDDDSPEKVDRQWELGATVAEFPVTIEAARRARERGMAIVVGAPNIVRGGSTSGNLDAAELFSLGLADVICADYHAPSLLLAAFKLIASGAVDIVSAVRTLTFNPACALGLSDVGAVADGYRANLALVREGARGIPHVEAVYHDGREVLASTAFAPVGAAS